MTKVTPERSRRSVKPPERFLNDYLLEKSFSSEKPTTLGKILKSKSAKGTCETIFQCNICGNELSSKHNLESHIASVHEGKKPHQCSICKKKFTQKGSLDAHVKNVHTEKKEEFKCEICNLNYSSKRVLKEHIELIHEMDNPNKCTICETTLETKTSFTNKGRLTEHIRTVHEG